MDKIWWRCCAVTKSCPTLCDPMDWSTQDFPVLHYLLEFAQTHIHRIRIRCLILIDKYLFQLTIPIIFTSVFYPLCFWLAYFFLLGITFPSSRNYAFSYSSGGRYRVNINSGLGQHWAQTQAWPIMEPQFLTSSIIGARAVSGYLQSQWVAILRTFGLGEFDTWISHFLLIEAVRYKT